MESGIHLVSTPGVPQRFSTSNPATGEPLGEYSIASAADVAAAVERARQAQRWWAALALPRRSAVLRRVVTAIGEQKETLARIITSETGKPLAEALLSDVLIAAGSAGFCAENAATVLRAESVPHSNPAFRLKSGRLSYQPFGVIGIISPWNYPLAVPAGQLFAALATGNAVVLKPSEFTPQTALELERILNASLDAEGLVTLPRPLQVVTGMAPTGEALVAAPIDKLIFTGGVAVGRYVAVAAAARLLPAVLELGGKDAMIVLADANLDVASSAAVWGSMLNAGQTCISVERCYVHQSIFPRFLELCRDKISRLNVGDGARPETDLGPLITLKHLQTVASQVEEARVRGATVHIGGETLPQLGPNFYAPTLISGVDSSMRLMREETFGPVLPLVPFAADEEAVQLANASDFGLSASVWGRTAHATAVARRIQSGSVLVNDVLTSFAICEAPHGGIRQSGFGRTHGMVGLREMVRPFYLDVDLAPGMKKLWWYPYAGMLAPMSAFTEMVHGAGIGRRLGAARRALPMFFRKRR